MSEFEIGARTWQRPRLRPLWIAVALSMLAAGILPLYLQSGAVTEADWTDEELALLASMRMPAPVPLPAADAAKAALGKKIFFDTRLSANKAISCASCHDPAKQFQDGAVVSKGMGTGQRRAMPLAGIGSAPFLFWDGRKDSVWSQALAPLEDLREHGVSRARHVRLLGQHYRAEYEAVFGLMPDLGAVPTDAGPFGTDAEKAAWADLNQDRRMAVSAAFANMGKALAAYLATLYYGPARFDRYVDDTLAGRAGAADRFGTRELRGLRVFLRSGRCIGCHSGPMFSDGAFHNTGVRARAGSVPDAGRARAIAALLDDEFNCLGPFSGRAPSECLELRYLVKDEAKMLGAFKTPSLRNVALRPPFMHAGQLASLNEVVAHYRSAPGAKLGVTELVPIRLSEREAEDLVWFLRTLSGPIDEDQPQRP